MMADLIPRPLYLMVWVMARVVILRHESCCAVVGPLSSVVVVACAQMPRQTAISIGIYTIIHTGAWIRSFQRRLTQSTTSSLSCARRTFTWVNARAAALALMMADLIPRPLYLMVWVMA